MFPYLLWYDILTVITYAFVRLSLITFFFFISLHWSFNPGFWGAKVNLKLGGWMSYLNVIAACPRKNEMLRFYNKDNECSHLWQNWSHHSIIACGCHIFIWKAFTKLSTAFTSGRFTFFSKTDAPHVG